MLLQNLNTTDFTRTLLDDADALTARATLGLTLGTNVQAWDATLDSLAALNPFAVGDLIYASGADAVAKLPDVATGSVLASTGIGVAPAYSATPTLTSVTAPTYYGGSGANDDATFSGTSHATKTSSLISLQPDGGDVVFSGAANGAWNFILGNVVGAAQDTSLFLRGGTKSHQIMRAFTDGNVYSYLAGTWGISLHANTTAAFWGVADSAFAYCMKVFGDKTTHFYGNVGFNVTPRGAIDAGAGVLVGTGLQLPHIINKAASANIRNSHDVESITQSTIYVKLPNKTITITNGLVGQGRFLFDIHTSNVLNTATARIYRNGVALGAEQTDVTGAYVTKSEDLTQTWNPGDTAEIWGKIDNAAQTCYVRNFRIAYDDLATVAVVSANS